MQPEVIDIGSIDNGPVITLNKDDDPSSKVTPEKDKPSVNFGGGIEFLMNDKLKADANKSKSDIDLGDVTELENELNDLTEDISKKTPSSSSTNPLENIKIGDTSDSTNSVKFEVLDDKSIPTPISTTPIATATASQSKDDESNKTWDGFGKFNNIPLDPDKQVPAQPKLTQEELLREKFKALRKLEAIEKKGVKLSKRYTMESSLQEMQGEYELILSERECSASCKFQGRMLMAAVTGLEFLNNRFDPFDVKLDGWAEQLNENIEDYDEIFAELHEKYKSKAKMAPELKLLFQLGGSAIMVHMTNTMFKSAMPGMDDIMRQNPELMQQFTQAAVNSMSDTSPGFSGFMNGVMGNDDTQPNVAPGPPPAPMPTQTLRSQRSQVPNNRPDMSAARGDDGINISENFGSVGAEPPTRSTKSQRPEMKGPSDISDLLSGLKTKTIDISAPNEKKDSSTISIQDLKEISDAKQPARSKRRQKSDKNVVSLEL
tara:strand:- start:133 stop:1596 length:1464 start_codon:yes stop_codon:yes gene_type:complete